MKNIACAVLLFILFTVGVGLAAGWEENFLDDYDEFGMGVAVENALDAGVSPDGILYFIVYNDFEIKRGLKALFCAGADEKAVRDAANWLGVDVEDVDVAYQESIAECGMSPAPEPDINGDGAIDLLDAIIGLREIAGIDTGAVIENYAYANVDMDGDSKLGLAEVIAVMVHVSTVGNN